MGSSSSSTSNFVGCCCTILQASSSNGNLKSVIEIRGVEEEEKGQGGHWTGISFDERAVVRFLRAF